MTRISWLLSLLTIAVTALHAYEYDEDTRSCDTDKCAVEIHTYDARCWVHDSNQMVHYMEPLMGGSHSIPNGCTRSNIFSGEGYLVAYPSIGGLVMIKTPSAIDLKYLGLPHTHDAAREAGEDEDGLATRMVQLGAQWWPDWNLYFRHSHQVEKGFFYNDHFPSKVDLAFPSTGGVWVANFTQDDLRDPDRRGSCEPWLPGMPGSWRIKRLYALTMDDKAQMMQDLDIGTFYSSVDEVSGLAKTVQEAAIIFAPFEERLKNMDDLDYRWNLCQNDDNREDLSSRDEL